MTRPPTFIEPLEARIALAIALQHPLPDLIAGPGKTGAVVDLSEMFDPAATSPNRTIVEFTTNFDTDTNTPGIQPGVIRLELFDDLVPLTVQNFLNYVNSRNARGDYEGTFFHRAVTGFVLQGGGFNSEGNRSHITTGLDLHNEFDPSRSNVRGTITMAKTGLGPHTATSEFFFNLADNSANLDAQNGGFTVFGNVIAGLDVIDRIVALPRQNVVSADFGAPVQNYTDPDGNPATVDPVPTRDQLIRITDARVIPPNVGNATGITFTVESIFDAGTTTPSNLVSGKISGTNLNLKYRSGAAGAVDVVVKAVGPGGAADTVTDAFRVTVRPNLIADFVSDPLPGFLTSGDAATVKLKISNSGAGVARGKVDVHFVLAEVNPSTGALVAGGTRVELGEVLDRSIAIAGGSSTIVTARLEVPIGVRTDVSKIYRLIAEVTPEGAVATQQLFADDDVALDGGNHQIVNQFGAFNTRTKVPFTYVESDGDRVTFTLTGGGFGRFTPDGDGGLDLTVFNTTAASRLTARVVKAASGDGRIALDDINLNAVLHTVALDRVDVTGDVAASGGLRRLELGDLDGPGFVSIGTFLPANTTSATIRFRSVSDYSIESLMPVASLTAVEWIAGDGVSNVINLASLGRLDITGSRGGARGDLEASVQVFGSGRVSSFQVNGLFNEGALFTNGDIGAITLGGINSSVISAGALEVIPADELANVASFRIKGIAGFAGNLFTHSLVVAERFGSIVVQKVDPGGASVRGFVADEIGSYHRIGGPRLSNLDDPTDFTPGGQVDLVGQYLVRIV